ncbi:type II toxin-antitoxin system HigB family toxin [Vreelandella massiliensis]|uniref:type II toxin-antitoxin system HigB family toxin n=1 Tax=Vreelandella massiliensis TaxID=1816686 RepID=UPI00096A8623|nr:type II toxin-antitoxin system HigB family toxin [Halomonas massiliensis]
MRVISRAPFLQAMANHPNDAKAVDKTYKALKAATFVSPDAMKAMFPSLDNFRYVDRWWVIDIGGNNLRLIAFVDFEKQRLFAKHLVTHAEYDKLCSKYAQEKRQ